MSNVLQTCCYNILQELNHFLCISENGKIVWINAKGLSLLQAPHPDSVTGHTIADFVTDDFTELFDEGLDLLCVEKAGIPLKLLTVCAKPVSVNMYVTRLSDGDHDDRFLVECQDISNLLTAAKETRSREQRMNAILKAVDQAVITIDEFGIINAVNDVTISLFGHSPAQMIGKNVSMLMPEPHRAGHDGYLRRYLTTGHSSVIEEGREFEAIRANGEIFPMELTVTRVNEHNGKIMFVGSIRDLTVLKAQEKHIRFLALNDSLTGLPNRASFNERMENSVKRAKRHETGVILMFIDLDKFKPINDKFGHDAGDLVLQTVAERLKNQIRNTDTAARLGGDEFVLVFENIDQKQSAVSLAKKIIREVSQPIDINGVSCIVGASIGISYFPTDGSCVTELLHAADQAMYKVKELGRNNYAFF